MNMPLFRQLSFSHWTCLFICICISAATTTAPAADDTPAELERRFLRQYESGQHEAAVETGRAYVRQLPRDATMLYNLACVLALTDEPDKAAQTLWRAANAGFAEIDHMQRDPDLKSIRQHRLFKTIVASGPRHPDRPRQPTLDIFRRQYGDGNYRYESDPIRNLDYASALDAVAHGQMKAMVEQLSDHLIDSMFEAAPDYRVLVAIPTAKTAHKLLRSDDSIGGMYDHGQRLLVTRDIGASLRHEFCHLMHFGDMERRGQMHPLWIQEGLATLYEDYQFGADGSIKFLPNERHNVVRNRVKAKRFMKWTKLIRISDDQFMSRASTLYPQVRSMFAFVASEGVLDAWYQRYAETYLDDPDGLSAFEHVFAMDIEDIELAWRKWVLEQPMIDARVDPGDGSLGIEADRHGSNIGVPIKAFSRDSAARKAGLRIGDVIVAVDQQSTRSLIELMNVVAQYKVGQTVSVRIKRRNNYETVKVQLRKRGS